MDLLQPMEPILTDTILNHHDFIHQVKWDGIRGLTYIQKDTLQIFTKKGNERTHFYPELHEAAKLLDGDQAVLDGEIVIFDPEGRPSFSDILVRERVRTLSKVAYYTRNYPVKYIVFDILSYNGKDLRNEPLLRRQEILRQHFSKSTAIVQTDNFPEGEALFKLMLAKNFEGIVSKNLNSPYIGGKKHEAWYKVKIGKKLLTVIGGIQLKQGFPNSLLIGIYRDSELMYIGNVSSGLKGKDYELLQQVGHEILSETCPFTNIDHKLKEVLWLQPRLTCWVHFLEWTPSGGIRHPQIIGFSQNSPLEANGKEIVL